MKKPLSNIHFDRKSVRQAADSPNTGQSFMLKMMISYSIFLLVILMLLFYLYGSGIKNARLSYRGRIQAAFAGNVALFEKDLSIMNAYCRQLLQNNDFKKLMKLSPDDPRFQDLGFSLYTTLSTDVYPEALLPIYEVFCYLPASGYILSPNTFVSAQRYYDWEKRYSEEHFEHWMKALTSPEYYYRFLPLDDYAPDYDRDRYMYIINLDDLYYMEAGGVVCFVMEKTELSSLFTCLQEDTPYRTLAMLTPDNGLSLSIHTPEGAQITDLLVAGTTDDEYFQSLGVSVGTFTSPDTGFTYYYTYPAFESSSNIARIQIVHLLLFLTVLTIGVILAFRFSKRNMRPIIELGHELRAAKAETTHLQEVVDSQRPIMQASYVRRLIKGTLGSEEEAEYVRDFLGLPDEALCYNSLYIVAYNTVTEAAGESRTAAECNRLVTDGLQQYLETPLYYVSPSDRTYAVILACNQEEEKDLVSRTKERIVKLHDYLLDACGIWLLAGIGRSTDNLMNVWESYRQAVEAVSYTGRNYVFYPYDLIKKDSSTFYYPPELSTKLIRFITSGNTPQVLELFNLLHQENIEERSLPINMLQFLLSDIRNSLLKARFALPPNVSDEEIRALDDCFSQHVSFKLCEDIALRLCRLFTAESEDTSPVSAIEQYILKNYMDPSMSLNKISDEFQISESYFSHMFKEKTGINFSNYLENIRMNEAARLIRETDISLNELYLSVGYNNANSFRRAFKKIFGVTPSAMREGKAYFPS
ncbi:MAG: AraC family transcriptional regulator [Roseburia sp.]|nr:AraC family transcriptional regulator [Roseburia sp.]